MSRRFTESEIAEVWERRKAGEPDLVDRSSAGEERVGDIALGELGRFGHRRHRLVFPALPGCMCDASGRDSRHAERAGNSLNNAGVDIAACTFCHQLMRRRTAQLVSPRKEQE